MKGKTLEARLLLLKEVREAGVVMAGDKILVVDDDPDFLQLLEFDLKKRGYEVVSVTNGAEALEQTKAEKPQLIVLDIKMPKMDGYTFVRLLKKDPETQEIPVIILTSYEPMRDIFRIEGINDYFMKSSNMEGLLEAIRRNLKTSKTS